MSCFGHGWQDRVVIFRQVGLSSEFLISHFIRNSGEQIIRKFDDQNLSETDDISSEISSDPSETTFSDNPNQLFINLRFFVVDTLLFSCPNWFSLSCCVLQDCYLLQRSSWLRFSSILTNKVSWQGLFNLFLTFVFYFCPF